MKRFFSMIMVIIIKMISMYSFSILSNIFKEGKKLRTSLEMAKYGLEERVSNFEKFEIWNFHISHGKVLSSTKMWEVDICGVYVENSL